MARDSQTIVVKIAIYAHFSTSDRVVPFAWPYLDDLAKLGFKIIFVSNSPVGDADSADLKERGTKLIVRENVGLDFSMWKCALESLDLSSVSQLLLTNSSIIGPLSPLAPILERAKDWNCDFWGMTDNNELALHLQSYFIMLSEKVIQSEAFIAFWKSVLAYQSKDQIVMSYEVGLTAWLQQNGFSWRPLVYQKDVWESYVRSRDFLRRTADRIIPGRGIPMGNTSLLFPDLLLEMGVPFLKSSLLKHGSRRITTQYASELLAEHWRYDSPSLGRIETEYAVNK